MADTNDLQGAWGNSRREDTISVRAGLEQWASAHNGSVIYARGADVASNSEAGFAAAEAAARQADVVILAFGESCGLSGEAAAGTHIDLPGNQQQLIDRISSLGKPVVLVLFSGRPLVLTPVVSKVDSILEVWFPATEAGHAIARILYGEVSPSGKLPMSFGPPPWKFQKVGSAARRTAPRCFGTSYTEQKSPISQALRQAKLRTFGTTVFSSVPASIAFRARRND